MMQSAKDAREARRRRILDRGADRLAYITGELKNSPLPVKHSPSSAKDPNSSEHHQEDFKRGAAAESFENEALKENGADDIHSTEAFEKREWKEKGAGDIKPMEAFEKGALTENGAGDSKPIEAIEKGSLTENGADAFQPFEVFEKGALELNPPLPQNVADDIPPFDITAISTGMRHASTSLRSNVPSMKADGISRGENRWSVVRGIIQTIDASEGLRALVALSLAVIIVSQSLLSSCGNPWGCLMHTWLPRWPLSLIFLTDFTIVLGVFFLFSSRKQIHNKLLEVDSDFGSFSRALDVVQKFQDFIGIGMLCKKAVSAVSLDCSIYVLVLVCGLSLGKYGFSCSQLPGPKCYM